LRVEDPIIELGGYPNGDPLVTNDGMDRGFLLHHYDAVTSVPVDSFIGWQNSSGNFYIASNASVVNNVVTFNQLGNLVANAFEGNAYSLAHIQGANVDGVVANATYSVNAGTAYSVDGANVSGEVANANYATFAGTVVASSQPNITSV
jgi:hypothetical protein